MNPLGGKARKVRRAVRRARRLRARSSGLYIVMPMNVYLHLMTRAPLDFSAVDTKAGPL